MDDKLDLEQNEDVTYATDRKTANSCSRCHILVYKENIFSCTLNNRVLKCTKNIDCDELENL